MFPKLGKKGPRTKWGCEAYALLTPVLIFQQPPVGKLIRGSEGLDVGDRVRGQFIGTDVERGFIDFAQAG
jgi:hypothetical protein